MSGTMMNRRTSSRRFSEDADRRVASEIEEAVIALRERQKKKKREIEQFEVGQKLKVEMMEAAMPAVIAWNMFRNVRSHNNELPFVPDSQEACASEEEMRRQIREKIDQLIQEQDAITELHVKAYETTKEREEELQRKIAVLEERRERDRETLLILRQQMD